MVIRSTIIKRQPIGAFLHIIWIISGATAEADRIVVGRVAEVAEQKM
jgi:hypothetical protein